MSRIIAALAALLLTAIALPALPLAAPAFAGTGWSSSADLSIGLQRAGANRTVDVTRRNLRSLE